MRNEVTVQTSFHAIETILKQEIGLDAAIIGHQTIQQGIKRRMKRCGVAEIFRYVDLLRNSREEFDELIEEVIVPETWFFRDQKSFDYLKTIVGKQQTNSIRILSVPCSSGEEAYSIALTLLDAGAAPSAIRVDAADISHKAIVKARAGIYGTNSLRGKTVVSLQQNEMGYAISPDVAQLVRFFEGNVMKDFLPDSTNLYDVIFFRNLLIYMTDAARAAAIVTMDRLLKDGGLLFVGHAEAAVVRSVRFQPDGPAGAFAFRKMRAEVKTENGQLARKPVRARLQASATAVEPRHLSGVAVPEDKDRTLIHKARQAADEGNLSQSEFLCNQWLEKYGNCAEIYSLLGVIALSKGHNQTAEDFFLKSLYLNPSHYEALIHLSLLKENQGNASAAAIFKRRAGKLQEEKMAK